MHKILIKLMRQSNAAFYGVSVDDTVEIDVEEYVRGVVCAEIGNAALAACEAQAIAARTFAASYFLRGKTITDKSSSHQAFIARKSYPANVEAAVQNTAGKVLTYGGKVLDTCPYSSSNGGQTVSSAQRWGGVRAYLISQADPWGMAALAEKRKAGQSVRKGHGVGRSQIGAMWAAKHEKSCAEILGFYYPGTAITSLEAGEEPMISYLTLLNDFERMAREHWPYVWGKAETGCVDCSGAFVWAYRQHGLTIEHGSNSIYHLHTGQAVPISEAKPGYAVFKMRKWREQDKDNRWYGRTPGDCYHIGAMGRNGKVLNAQSSSTGFVESDPASWAFAAPLIEVDYTGAGKGADDVAEAIIGNGTVKLNDPSSVLQIRAAASTSSAILRKIKHGTTLNVLENCGDWLRVSVDGTTGYAAARYVEWQQTSTPEDTGDSTDTVTVDRAELERVYAALGAMLSEAVD